MCVQLPLTHQAQRIVASVTDLPGKFERLNEGFFSRNYPNKQDSDVYR